MKKIMFFLLVLPMLLALPPAEGATNVEISNFEGRTSILRDGKVIAPDVDTAGEAGDVLRIEKDSTMDLSMNFVLAVRFFGPAECELKDIGPSGSHLKMNSGTAMVNMKTLPSDDIFELETPATVTSSKNGKFLVQLLKQADKTTLTAITVKIGTASVYIKSSSSAVTVIEGRRLEIAEDSFIPSSKTATEEQLKVLDRVLSVYIVEPPPTD